MSISKPSWLRSALERLNWDVLTWKIYVGDAIENGIDWAIEWINWGLDQASKAYSKAIDAWNYAVSLSQQVYAYINTQVSSLSNRISAWWSDLADWWLAKLDYVRGLISNAISVALDLLDDLRSGLNNMISAWDNFRTGTLPSLFNISAWLSFWGQAYSSITEWWDPRRRGISDEIDGQVGPVRDEVNKQLSYWDLIKGLLTNPTETIITWLTQIAKSHLELILKLFDKIMDSLWS